MKKFFCFVCSIIISAHGYAQLFTANNAGITITTGATVSIKGDIQNNAGTTIDNSGSIDLTGNWTNNSGSNCFGTSQGTVIFNGAAQSIGGTSSTTFNNVALQGTGTKTLLINTTTGGGNVVPAGILNVGNVILDLNSRSLNISNTATGAITYGTGHILSEDADNSSKVTWTINSITGTHTIPFGNAAGVQIPFTFNLNSGNAGDVTVSTYPTAPGNTPYPVTPVLVTHVRNNSGTDNSANTVDRFWEIDPTGNPVAALTFTYAPTENAAAGNTNVRGQRWNFPQQAWESPLSGQINPTSQSVFVPNVTTFGPWALALESSPLPVELLFFNASPVNNKEVLCSWITASEINNDYFTIEKSKDGNEFEEAGKLKGAGNSTTALNYSFSDEKPYPGLSYYRLKQTDFNGEFSYSQVVAVHVNKSESEVLVYPKPATDHFVISFPAGEQENYILSIIDATGRTVLSKTGKLVKNINFIEFNVSALARGIYSIQLVMDNSIRQSKIILR